MAIELKTLAGTVSHASQQSQVYGHMQQGRGNIRTKQWISFRVNNRPTLMNGLPSVADGDVVTVIGVDKGGEFAGYSVRNHSTGVDYTCPASRVARSANTLLWSPVVGALLTGSGSPIAGVIFLIMFSPCFFIGLKFRRHAIAFKKANAMLPSLLAPVGPAPPLVQDVR
jgi:hypothetical protein